MRATRATSTVATAFMRSGWQTPAARGGDSLGPARSQARSPRAARQGSGGQQDLADVAAVLQLAVCDARVGEPVAAVHDRDHPTRLDQWPDVLADGRHDG